MKHTFVFQPTSDGFSANEVGGPLGQSHMTRQQMHGWMRNAVNNDVGVYNAAGVAVTARVVKITVEFEEAPATLRRRK